MHTILIVEDDNAQRELLVSTIHKQYPDWMIHSAANYERAIGLLEYSLLKDEYFTLFLFDVQLAKENSNRGGFDLAKEVRRNSPYYRVPILFLTSISDERSFALSEFHCYNYITKPYSPESILNQIEQMLITGYLENTLEITDTDRIQHRILINDIISVETKSHTLLLTTKMGTIITRQYTLERILPLLGKSFFQCHKRIVINRSQVCAYDKTLHYITMRDTTIPIGRAFTERVYHVLDQRS